MKVATLVTLGLLGTSSVVAVPQKRYKAMTAEERPGDTTEWAAFVGQRADDVVKRLREENPELKTVVAVRYGQPVTMDFRLDRVRVFHDDAGLVVRPPKPG
mmetsp:Transcript_1256/g.3184  ORF Transcript_1256/g.3184 Transcript_1256/m.3184 type:complete len:101 (-) Transcript_1256:225-527(-)